MFAKRRLNTFKPVGGLFLLLAYLFVSFFAKVSHLHSHSDESTIQVIHSEETEADNCHRTLYHAAKNDGCEHREHFLPDEESCELCASIVPNVQYLDDYPDFRALYFGLELKNPFAENKKLQSPFILSSPRAPPVFNWI